jgi:caffeoyl-CoA O-methyltransferase
MAADDEMSGYAATRTTASSGSLQAVAASTMAWSDRAELMIDEAEGQLLRLLVALSGARRVVEIGTFTGYSALAMAEALPPDGHIDTLELSPEHATKAREHIEAAGEGDRITVHLGIALDSLKTLEGPYDFAFIDADKSAYAAYYDALLPRMRPGGLIVADNVLRHGRILGRDSDDPSVTGMQAFNDKAVSDPRVDTVMLTVRDGVSLIRVRRQVDMVEPGPPREQTAGLAARS